MRPRAPSGYHPTAPAANPQIGKALPRSENEPAPGVVHSRQVFWFGHDNLNPLSHAATVATATGVSRFGLCHYNGTIYYVGTADALEEGVSATFYAENMAAMTTEEAVTHMAARLNGANNPGLAAVRGTSFWPWSARAVRQLNKYGDLWWSLEIIRGYPAGAPGTEASRSTPIIGHLAANGVDAVLIPELPASGGQNLLGVSLTDWYPGERGWDLAPARFSKANRAVLPLGPAPNGGNIETVPYEIPQAG